MKRLVGVMPLLVLVACASVPRRQQELRLYVFDCGWARLATVAPFGVADHETDVREAPFPCYMIEHPRGRLLWDGGIASVHARMKGWQEVMPGYSVRLDRTLADQLAELGLTLDSIDYVAFSHLHWDHAGIANELRGPTLIIQQAEYDAAFAPKVTVPAFDTAVYAGLRNMKRRTITGDHDVFGDGRVRVISAPGHTPGHQVLMVKLAETGTVALSGDLYHFRVSRERQRIPVFNVDSAQTRRSMHRVEALLREEGAQLWIHHDPARFATLRKAPAYYR
jgi:N-acyl homoserine lactone hydrolase